MDKQALFDTLRQLIRTSEEGMKDFAQASEKATDPPLKSELYNRSHLCAKAVQDLQAMVLSLGSEPERDGGLPGAGHRGPGAGEAPFSASDRAVLQELERGEDHAREVYRNALNQDLPAPVRMMVEEQYQGILGNQDRVRDLRASSPHAA